VDALLDSGTPAILRWTAGRLIQEIPRQASGPGVASLARALLEVRARLDAIGAGGSRVDPLLDEDPGRALLALRAELEATIAALDGSSPGKAAPVRDPSDAEPALEPSDEVG
jgi:hypothetical protein